MELEGFHLIELAHWIRSNSQSSNSIISIHFEPFEHFSKPIPYTKCVDCYVCVVVWIDCIVWTSFQSVLVLCVVQLSLLEISVGSWWKVLVGAWALSDSHVSPRNQHRPKLGSFPRISQQRDGQWNSLNTLSLSTSKSLNNGMQQYYEKYSQNSKLANFFQTVLSSCT